MRIVINPQYEPLREWIESLPTQFANEGSVIYDDRNQIRIMRSPDGGELCVKRYHAPRGLNRLIYSYYRAPKAVRAYDNAIRLLAAGIPTPTPIGYILETRHGLLDESYLICLRSPLTRNFYEFRHHPLEGYEPIVRSFAQFTAQMHRQGILHLDYSPGNILFDIAPNGNILFDIVDINRMRWDQPVTMDTACRNFCRLWGNEDFFRLLAKEYALARGFDTDQCTRLTIRYWKRFWRYRQ